MNPQPAITNAAALIADPARAAMLVMLVDGRARPAGELAHVAGVSAQTASSHLAKLLAGGLLSVEQEGRHRYYRLAGPEVASLLKHLALFGSDDPVRRKAPNRDMERLRFARCCYDHLAGSLGVEMTKAMLDGGYISNGKGKAFIVTPAGVEWFGEFGLDVARIAPTRHGIARQCLDLTEREHHIAGPLATQFLAHTCTLGWFHRPPSTRVIEVTPKGWRELKRHLDIDRQSIGQKPGADCASRQERIGNEPRTPNPTESSLVSLASSDE